MTASTPGRVRARAAAAALAAALVGLGGLLVPAGAAPTEAERAQAQSAVDSQAGRVAELEGDLAAANTALADAEVAAAVAGEDYLAAEVRAEEARTAKVAADEAVVTAQAEADTASDALAAVALASYRNGGGVVRQAQIFLGADEFADVLRRSAAMSVATDAAGTSVHTAREAQNTADVAADRATTAQETLTTREDAAKEALAESERLQEDATAQRDATAAVMTSAVAELATLRNRSIEVERAYQEDLLAQQRAAEEKAAQDRLAAASRSVAAPAAAAPAPAPTTSAPAPTTAPTQAPTQAPAPQPTQAPAPQPTQAPAPQPTQAPAPQPTQAPAPAPAPAPSPTPKPTPPPAPAPAPPVIVPPATSKGQEAVNAAMGKVGLAYKLGANGPSAYDCSSLVKYAYSTVGITLPRVSRDQWKATTRISQSELQPGDLIFWSNNGAASGIYHVAIYTGPGMKVHAAKPGVGIVHDKIYSTNLIGYGRVS
ncbi:glycoside hydrolase [Serinibacter arcticus]|uniref:Glycoside hydrolase n=1 Tax=Serinibacter arcticus TaxID=1655435 RepID=A0A2U1ZUI2_9MICO|nr:NlpC/P60 family protein [Serinibacter arcticus]PWD50613.1 glycoside hydrolase [Serinibacter arcticus]